MPYIPPAEPGKRYTSMFCAVTHPYSRGSVHIASSDPLAPPAIDPKYFSHPLDIDLAVGALAFAHRVLRTPPLGDRVGKSIAPAEDVIAMGKAGLEGYVREFCGPVYHPVGTAAMMRWEDGGVVDAELKVYGTSNLRVVSPCNGPSKGVFDGVLRLMLRFCPWYGYLTLRFISRLIILI